MSKFRLGLVINPFAGIGGALALKGSDGADIRAKALAMGAKPQAQEKTRIALIEIADFANNIEVFTAADDMGEQVALSCGFDVHICYRPAQTQTEGEDTEAAAKAISAMGVDLLLFAGGDGTARNLCTVVGEQVPVLGIPAGCKIHSGVFAVTPKAAGLVVKQMLQGELVSLVKGEVRDLDEALFRQNQVIPRYFGQMQVPQQLSYVQAVKSGGRESQELVLQDIADYVIEQMGDELYIMGSGSTVDFIMQQLGLDNSLLGVDLVQNQQLLSKDLTAAQLLEAIQGKPCKLLITLIGGQGHILGRGNQQLSPEVIRALGKDNMLIVATKTKLEALNGRPLLVDSGDPELDKALCGYLPIITGYNDKVLYPVDSPQ